jgi:outer membrane protein
MIKRCSWLLPLCILFFSSNGLAQEKWDLQKCIDYAMANNLTVKQARIQAGFSKLTAIQTEKTRLPSLNGSLSSSYQRGLSENPTTGILESNDFISGSLGFQANYTIFNWGSRKHNINANNLFAKADEINIDKAQNDIGLLVANAFLQVMLAREQVRTSKIQLQQSQQQYSNTRKLVDAGSQPELNAVQIEAQVVRDSSLIIQAQSQEAQALITLKAYLNIDMALPFDIQPPALENIQMGSLLDLQPERVYEIAVKTQPMQQVLDLRLQANKKQVLATRGAMYPSLSAFAGLNTRYINIKSPVIGVFPDKATGSYVNVGGTQYPVFAPSFGVVGEKATPLFDQLNRNFGQSVGISINLPIFNQWTSRTQWERAKLSVTQTQVQTEQENQSLKTDIYNAYQQAYAALQKYNASVRSVEASQLAFDYSQKRFDIGLLGTLDYITTQNNLFRAKIEAISNRYDYIFKMKVLEFYRDQNIKL